MKNLLVTASTSIDFTNKGYGNEFTLALRTGDKTKVGVYVHLTPVVEAEMGCSLGTLSGGEIVDEPDEPVYVEWSGRRYGLAEGDVEVEPSVFKVVDGTPGGLTVDMENLEITSENSWHGIVKIKKNLQSKRYLWKPPDPEEEAEAVVYATYEGKTGIVGENVSKTEKALLKTSIAITTVKWPPDEDRYPITLSVGRQDNKEGCVYVYQTPNTLGVKRGCDIGSLEDVTVVETKKKEIYTVWNGHSLSLPSGLVYCDVSVYMVYQGSPAGIVVDYANEVATSEEDWIGIVKLTTIVESRKLKWIPPDVEKRTKAVVHVYRRGSVAMENVEWIPNKSNVDLRLEISALQSGEKPWPMKDIKVRLYPPLDEIVLSCTEGGFVRGQRVMEEKTKYLEFSLPPLPEIDRMEDSAWEPDDDVDNFNHSTVTMGVGLIGVKFEPLDCFDREGVLVTPKVEYDVETGIAQGDLAFYGLVKATYEEEYREIFYRQAWKYNDNNSLSLLTGYIYARYEEQSTFLEIPWDYSLPSERKELYQVFSYFVTDRLGTWEYPDNWLSELEEELALRKRTREEWEDLIESREPGTFDKDSQATIDPENNAIMERVHRSATFDWLGQVTTENYQPVRGHYYKPYTDVKPSPTSEYKPKYFLRFGEPPELWDDLGEFGDIETEVTSPEFKGEHQLYLPNDAKEAILKGWIIAYNNFDQDKIHEELEKEFPGLIRLPLESK